MRKLCTRFLLATMVLLLVPTLSFAETVVVEFEDDFGDNPIPDGYGGIASWGTTGDPNDYWTIFETEVPYPPHSGTHAAYQFGLGTSILFGTEYVFDGAYFGGPALPFETVFYTLYLAGTLVHTSEEFVINGDESIWCPSGYDLPVDEVHVWQNAGFSLFVMDDFTYTTTGVATEASSLSAVKDLYR